MTYERLNRVMHLDYPFPFLLVTLAPDLCAANVAGKSLSVIRDESNVTVIWPPLAGNRCFRYRGAD